VKKIIEETNPEGLEKLLGETVMLLCLNYIYTGKLTAVNSDCVLLSKPSIVYETGPWSSKGWKDAQALPSDLYVMRAGIESYGKAK
jgi:hypothetical protein